MAASGKTGLAINFLKNKVMDFHLSAQEVQACKDGAIASRFFKVPLQNKTHSKNFQRATTMSNKFFFTIMMYGVGMASLSAQATTSLHAAGMGDSDVTGVIDLLEHNALMALFGFVVLMAILFICHISKACAGLNRTQKNARNFIILVAGLSSFCGSCSVEQRAMAAQYRAAEAAEYRNCPSPYQHGNYANIPFNNRNPSSMHGSSFCRYCGKRIDY